MLVAINMSSSPKRLVLSTAADIPACNQLRTALTNLSMPKVELGGDVELPSFGVWVAA